MLETIATPIVSRTATELTPPLWQGFDAFCEGAQLEDMPTEEHKRGWWWACQCAGDTAEYADNVTEREFIRFGGN